MDDNNNQSPPNIPFITPDQTKELFQELGFENLPEDKKADLLNTMIDTVMDRIFQRVEPSLTSQDEQMLKDLEMRPNADQAIVGYLTSVVPNLDQIATEEIQKYKQELKTQISTIMEVLNEEAAKLPDETSEPEQPQEHQSHHEHHSEHLHHQDHSSTGDSTDL